jgi:CheY-like chemotaxis protein
MAMEDLNMMLKKKVLVIDDNETILVVTKDMLENDYNVTTVTSGEAAMKLFLKGFIPKLVLMDMYMPGMSGWNTLIKIRRICESHKTRIAIYTSAEDPEGMVKLKEYGAADYIHKPISRFKLLEKVANLVN